MDKKRNTPITEMERRTSSLIEIDLSLSLSQEHKRRDPFPLRSIIKCPLPRTFFLQGSFAASAGNPFFAVVASPRDETTQNLPLVLGVVNLWHCAASSATYATHAYARRREKGEDGWEPLLPLSSSFSVWVRLTDWRRRLFLGGDAKFAKLSELKRAHWNPIFVSFGVRGFLEWAFG